MSPHARSGIGLALSGGAARCLAQIAVIDVLEQEGVPIHGIAGTSAGSIIGALYCAGMPITEMRRVLTGTRWNDIFKFTVPRTGLISSDGIRRFMESILPVNRFSSLPLPFAAVATDLRSGDKVVITSGPVSRAVQASCSLPVIFTPTEINRKMLVDGGVSSQVPVTAVRETLGIRTVVAVNVNYQALELQEHDTIIKIAAHLSALWASRNAREEMKLADVVINVNAKGIALYDLSRSGELLKRGEKAAREMVPEVKDLIA